MVYRLIPAILRSHNYQLATNFAGNNQWRHGFDTKLKERFFRHKPEAKHPLMLPSVIVRGLLVNMSGCTG